MTTREPSPEQRLGQTVRAIRERRGWSQRQLARTLAGTGWQGPQPVQSVIARIEAATRPVRLNEVHWLAAALAVPVAELIGADEPAPAAAELASTVDAVNLHALITQLDMARAALNGAANAADAMRSWTVTPTYHAEAPVRS